MKHGSLSENIIEKQAIYFVILIIITCNKNKVCQLTLHAPMFACFYRSIVHRLLSMATRDVPHW